MPQEFGRNLCADILRKHSHSLVRAFMQIFLCKFSNYVTFTFWFPYFNRIWFCKRNDFPIFCFFFLYCCHWKFTLPVYRYIKLCFIIKPLQNALTETINISYKTFFINQFTLNCSFFFRITLVLIIYSAWVYNINNKIMHITIHTFFEILKENRNPIKYFQLYR